MFFCIVLVWNFVDFFDQKNTAGTNFVRKIFAQKKMSLRPILHWFAFQKANIEVIISNKILIVSLCKLLKKLGFNVEKICFFFSCFGIPYARHYNPRFVYFYPIFHCGLYCRAVSVTDNFVLKQGNSSIVGSKIRSL